MTGPARCDELLRLAIAEGPERPDPTAGREPWQDYAARLSRRLAQAFADALRGRFRGVRPTASGEGHESGSSSASGRKRLDVNFSTVLHGLGLGVSIKTINKQDRRTGNFRHNFGRVDNEFRAEAAECHRRQPYAVLVGVLFLPQEACEDSTARAPDPPPGEGLDPAVPPRRRSARARSSSFGAAVKALHPRCRRRLPTDEADRFEKLYVALYRSDGQCVFSDVETPPPRLGMPRPETALSFGAVVEQIDEVYRERNGSRFVFDDGRS